MLHVTRIDRNARYSTDHVDAIGPVGLAIGDERWADIDPGRRVDARYQLRSRPPARFLLSAAGPGDLARGSRHGRRQRSRRRMGRARHSATRAWRRPRAPHRWRRCDLRLGGLGQADRTDDVGDQQRIALRQVVQQPLQCFAALGRFGFAADPGFGFSALTSFVEPASHCDAFPSAPALWLLAGLGLLARCSLGIRIALLVGWAPRVLEHPQPFGGSAAGWVWSGIAGALHISCSPSAGDCWRLKKIEIGASERSHSNSRSWRQGRVSYKLN